MGVNFSEATTGQKHIVPLTCSVFDPPFFGGVEDSNYLYLHVATFDPEETVKWQGPLSVMQRLLPFASVLLMSGFGHQVAATFPLPLKLTR